MQKEYKTIKEISGPLVFVEKTEPESWSSRHPREALAFGPVV